MLTVCCWSWGGKFGLEYPRRLRASLERHLHVPHELVLVSDDVTYEMAEEFPVFQVDSSFTDTPRCRRRMVQFSREFAEKLGARRILAIDLDVVIVNDITPIVSRPEPIVGWRVRHTATREAQRVVSGSFLLFDAGALHGAWERFRDDPEGYPDSLGGLASDQAMVNDWLASQPPIPYWTEADGFVTYFGKGYERFEFMGVGPNQQRLPGGARIVVLGGEDKRVMDEGAYDWVRQHWTD